MQRILGALEANLRDVLLAAFAAFIGAIAGPVATGNLSDTKFIRGVLIAGAYAAIRAIVGWLAAKTA